MTSWHTITLVVLMLMTSPGTSGPLNSHKPTSIQDVIDSKVGHLYDPVTFVQDPDVNPYRGGLSYPPPKQDTSLVATGRDYSGGGGGGYGGGGGGGYGGGSMMAYSSNYDTALTALAFLSFGVFLLNLLLMAMNRTGTGRRRRETSDGDVNSLAEMIELVHEAVSTSLFDAPLPECALSRLCAAKQRYSKGAAFRLASTFLTPIASQGIEYVFGNALPLPSILQLFEPDRCEDYRHDCFQISLRTEADLSKPKSNPSDRDKWKKSSANPFGEYETKGKPQFRFRRSSMLEEMDWDSTWDSLQLLINYVVHHDT